MQIINKQGKIEQLELRLTKPLEGKRLLIKRLMTSLARNYWQVFSIVRDWDESMLADSLRFCEGYNSVKARNHFFNVYVSDTKK